jgi:hypothetical protein
MIRVTLGQLGVIREIPAEDISDGNVDEIVVLAQQLRLRSFPAPLRANQDKFVHI